MPRRPPYRLHDSILYQLTLTARMQERRLEDGLRSLGLSRITWCVLLAVRNEGLNKPSQIAEFIGVDRTSTSRALRQMEAAGWLARHCGTGDRRTRSVALTDRGEELLHLATPLAEENSRHFLGKLTAAEATTLSELLARLRAGESRPLDRF